MMGQYLRLSAVALASAATAFGLFALGSVLAWRVFPFPAGADDLQRQIIWTWHVFGEKCAQFIFLAALGIVSARIYHPAWRVGVCTAVAAGLLFQAIAVYIYVIRFGFVAYRAHHAVWDTLLSTVSIAGLFGFLAVYRQYRAEKHKTA